MALETEPRKMISYAFIFLIALVFTLQFGPGSKGCESGRKQNVDSMAASVNGKEITRRDFSRAYAMQIEMYRNNRMPLTEDLARQLGLPKQVLDQLIDAELLAQEADHRGIGISDEELLAELKKDPSFQKDGHFDYDRYREVLSDFLRKTPQDYEKEMRRRMSAAKLNSLVEQTAQVSDDEVRTRFLRDQNTANLTYVRFLPTMFAAKVAPPKPAELEAFKKAEAAAIAKHYETNKPNYEQPEQIHARSIMLRSPKDDPEAKRAEVKARLEGVRKEIEGGKDFAELAKAVSEDLGTKNQGGDLGWVDRLSMPNEVGAAAFALEPGKVTAVVESAIGYHLVKVEEKRAASTRQLAQVEDEITKQLYVKEKAKALARAEAEKALAGFSKPAAGQTLAKKFPPEKEGQPAVLRYETETKPEAVTTGKFPVQSEQITHLGAAPELSKDITALEGPKMLSRVYSVGEGFVVAEVTERSLAKDEDFKAQLETLRSEARQAKQSELRESFLKSLRKDAKVITNDEIVGSGPVGRS